VFHRNILCCFIKEPIGLANLEHFNIDNVCWESDFPHSDGTWPEAPEVLSAILGGLDDTQIDKITHANAMRHYHILFLLRGAGLIRPGIPGIVCAGLLRVGDMLERGWANDRRIPLLR
jgi:hypothetical protein